jgi:hypothetical protein
MSAQFIEICARCGREAPSPVFDPDTGMSPRVAQGWVLFEGDNVLTITVPIDESILPPDLVEAVRRFEGLIRLLPLPETSVAETLEVESAWLGNACPDCLAETDWDDDQWRLFMTGPEARRTDWQQGRGER